MKKIAWIIFFLTSGRLVETTAQIMTAGKNAIMEKTPREAMTTVVGASHTTVQTAIQYFDGLGRANQTVIYKGSADASKDIFSSSTQYDAFGRAYKNILPTPSEVGTGAFRLSVQNLATTFYENDANPFTETVFDGSPLNRPKQQFGAGQAWRTGAGYAQNMAYLTAGTEILHLEIRSSGTIEKVGTYGANTLFCTRMTSERNFQSNEYKDRLGRVVAKSQEQTEGQFAITLYLYDDLNRLRYVIPPEAYGALATKSSFTEADALFKEGIYGYHYDTRGRVSEKHIPGGGWTYLVYHQNDLVVMQADEADKANNYWQFTQYDALNRVIKTGLVRNIGGFSRTQIQQDFDDYDGQTYETRTAQSYTNVSFPSSYTPAEVNTRTVTYYDDYTWQTDNDYNFKAAQAFHAQANTKGLVTGTLMRNLQTNAWQKMVMYYDYKGRIIQDFHLTNRTNLIRKDYQYRFNGELLKTRIEKKNSANALLSTKILTWEYDHLGRKTKYKYSLNGSERTIASYIYDDIGRMTIKSFSPSDAIASSQTGLWTSTGTWQGGSIPTISDNVRINAGHTVTIPSGQVVSAGSLFDGGVLQNFGTLNLGTLTPSTSGGTLQTLNYKYHIRGELKGTNLDASGNLTNNLFSYKLDYETANFYDGNIGKQSWRSNIDNKERSFTFDYDGASRLKSGTYASTQVGENYSLNNVNYDKNGNIINLSRNGATNNNFTSFGNVDNLTYTYQSNSNKLAKIGDITTSNADLGDFRDGVNTDDDYEYWLDGSLKKIKIKKLLLSFTTT